MVRGNTVIDMLGVVLDRFPFMEALGAEPKEKRTLVSDLDCSRSTVDRGIRDLEALDLVAYVDGCYQLTPLGEAVATGVADLAATVDLRLQYEPFLEWMPEDEFDLELELLRDADLVLPEQGDPYAMINRHVTVIEQTDDLQCVLPVVGLHAYKASHKQIMENGARVEAVVSPEAADTLQSAPEYAKLTEEMAATGRYELHQYDGDIPYFVGLLDDTVQIGVDEAGEPRALVETDNAEVQDWATATFEEYKQQAAPIVETREKATVRS